MEAETVKMLTVKEVCARLRIAKSTLYRNIASGKIRVVRVGRTIRIPESEISG